MDVLFVVGRGSKFDNAELRWALRSLEMHASNLGNVAIVGYPPQWLDPNAARLMSVPDGKDAGGKHVNIMNCILTAIDEGLVSGEFLYSSDDHFLVRDVDLDNYPYWLRRDRIESAEERKARGKTVNNWAASLSDTRDLLESEGLPTYGCDCHLNTHFHCADREEVGRLVDLGFSRGYTRGFEPTDMFMNVRISREQMTLTHVDDHKFNKFETVSGFTDRLGSSDTFSIGDGMMTRDFGSMMNLMYRRKSRFEL